MRTASLFTPAALLSLHILSTHAEPICHTESPLSSAEVPTAHIPSLQAALGGEVADFCGESLNTRSKDTFVQKVEGVTFQITGGTPKSIEECTASFTAIIAQCYLGQSLHGGHIQGEDGATYEVYHGDSIIEERDSRDDQDDIDDLLHLMGSGSLENRAPPSKKPVTPVKPPPKQPDSRPLPIGKPKPTPTPTPSAPKPAPTKSCKQIYDIAFQDVLAEALELEQEEPLSRRAAAIDEHNYVGGMTSRRNMVDLEKRTKKPGSACGIKTFDALEYPESGVMPATAKFYHFTDPTACDALGFAGEAKEARGLKRTDYQIEHVLEWQVVTKFFDWVQIKKGDEDFDDPDPKKTKPIKFCPYFKATWEGANSPVFKLDPKDKQELNAMGHLKWAYPGKGNFENEFVWLHTAVNSPAKSQMWQTKVTDGIYGDKTTRKVGGKDKKSGKVKPDKIHTGMTDLIVGTKEAAAGKIPQTRPTIDSARQAYFKLKWILGARLYLKNAEIKAIFKKQKERIGDVLDKLDTAMETKPKTNTKGEVMGAWRRQGLKTLWDEYMEEKFATAKKRSENDMNKYLRLLEGKWQQTKDLDAAENDRLVFLLQIRKLKTAWAAEKDSWTAPWK